MLKDDFDRTINTWIDALEKRSWEQLCMKPSSASCSLGQLYVHLIENTTYFLEQVQLCLSTDEFASETMTAEGKKMFELNAFPDALIEGPPENTMTPQPASKEDLKKGMLQLKREGSSLGQMILASGRTGKTQHPGLRYLNAQEWFQFAEMHLRHHFRQKSRIDAFLLEAAY